MLQEECQDRDLKAEATRPPGTGLVSQQRKFNLMVTTAHSGRDVGPEPVEGFIWIVHYRSVALGVFSERINRVYELEEFRLEG